MVDIVNGLLVRDGAVLMAKRSGARPNYPNCWSFPGGHVETNERLRDAVHRELMEEIGVTLHTAHPLAYKIQDGDVTFHFFQITKWIGTPANLEEEHSEIRWVSLNKAGDLPNLAFAAYRDICPLLDVT